VCSVTGWSAVASASANATLAAVLAGFMLNGIVLLLGSDRTAHRPGYLQALSLLFTAFIALGLDAYLFGMVTGDSTNLIRSVVPAVTACRRTWTEAMLAAGLLGIGTVAIVAAFVFLFAVYFDDHPRELRDRDGQFASSLRLLQMLGNAVRSGVALVVIAVLYMTARSYLLAIFGGQVPIWGKVFIYGYLAVGLAAVVMFTVVIFVPLPEDRRLPKPIAHLLANVLPNWQPKWRTTLTNWLTKLTGWLADRLQPKGERFVRILRRAIFWALGYSVVTVIAAVAVASSAAHLWHPTYGDVKTAAALTVFWISIVALIPVVLLTGVVVPRFPEVTKSRARHPAPTGEQYPA
jgi:hypothetical protein